MSPNPPYPDPTGGFAWEALAVGNGGKAQSKFEDSTSGEGGALNKGAVFVRERPGLANGFGERRPSPGLIGDCDALTGVN